MACELVDPFIVHNGDGLYEQEDSSSEKLLHLSTRLAKSVAEILREIPNMHLVVERQRLNVLECYLELCKFLHVSPKTRTLFFGAAQMPYSRSILLTDVFAKISESRINLTFNTSVRLVWTFQPELSRCTAHRVGYQHYLAVSKLQKGFLRVKRETFLEDLESMIRVHEWLFNAFHNKNNTELKIKKQLLAIRSIEARKKYHDCCTSDESSDNE